MLLTDLAKDCYDALRTAKVYVDKALEENLRQLYLLDVGESSECSEEPAGPSLMRFGTVGTMAEYKCLLCNRPCTEHKMYHFHFLPSYLAAICDECEQVMQTG